MPYYEEGRYKCRIVGQEFGVSDKKKTPFFRMRMIPMELLYGDGEVLAVSQEYERDIRRYLTDGTIDFVLDDLESLGFRGNTLSELDPQHPQYHSLAGVEFTAECKYESNGDSENAKQFERWDMVREYVPREVQPLEQNALQKLDALFGAQLKERRMNRPASTQPASQVTAPASLSEEGKNMFATDDMEDVDDVPF